MNNLRIIAKVTSVILRSAELGEYVVSEDFIFPFTYLEDDCDMFRSPGDEAFGDNETDTEKFFRIQNSELIDDFTYPQPLCACIQRLAYINFRSIIKVRVDANFFSLIMVEFKRSRAFRAKVLNNFYVNYVQNRNVNVFSLCPTCNTNSVLFQVIVYLRRTNKNILDIKWNQRIQVLVNEKCDLENAMAWLSTLGGAFSALGDTYMECAEKAGAISVQQLRIALRLGDPLTVCRCKIYLAMSLLQRGYFRKTKRIIRDLYMFSTKGDGSKDFRLKNMCIAVWNRLKYLKSQTAICTTNIH